MADEDPKPPANVVPLPGVILHHPEGSSILDNEELLKNWDDMDGKVRRGEAVAFAAVLLNGNGSITTCWSHSPQHFALVGALTHLISRMTG